MDKGNATFDFLPIEEEKVYLVVEVGYEGIDGILRAFSDPKDALKFFEEKKKLILESKDKEYSLMDEFSDGEQYRKDRAERLCIQIVSNTEEAKCVCQLLGLSEKEDTVWY
jgi:hypothetical protein